MFSFVGMLGFPHRAPAQNAGAVLSGRFWNESFVSLPFSPLLERYYYGAQYLLAISSRGGHAAPGIFGPFNTNELGSPASAWGGDIHSE